MVDKKNSEFDARLDAALAMNGLDNAAFASAVNPVSGQQTVNRWRARGRIGQPSIPLVRQLLPRTNVDWLQEGTGPAERVSPELNAMQHGPQNDVRHSYATRLDVPMLAQALGVLEVAEYKQGRKYRALDAATRLASYYDRLLKGEKQADLIAQIVNNDDQGSDNDEHLEGAGDFRR